MAKYTLSTLAARLEEKAPLTEDELDQCIADSDPANAKHFYDGDAARSMSLVQHVLRIIVDAYLNNPHHSEVSLRRKTKFCLVLNNFALYKPVRPAVFASLDDLTSIFENAIRDEGKMPFLPELGRMSEHVLVLLIRVMDYKLPASAVHEFADYKTQFAIQLLLAILLKVPHYEFELRCSCIDCLYGFTMPQTFFSAGSTIEEQSCASFTEKINFMLNLMIHLRAIDVVGDVLEYLNPTEPIVMAAYASIMRMSMNIFKYCSAQATQWRQHILLSTNFIDNAVTVMIRSLLPEVQLGLLQSPHAVPLNKLGLLNLAFKFGAFASYHLDEAALELRFYCTFFHDAFQLSLRAIVADARLSSHFMLLFVNLMHWMCNVDALRGEQGLEVDEVLPELRSAALRHTVEQFLRREVVVHGLPFLQAWQQQFQRGDTDALIARDSATFVALDALFATLAQEFAVAAPSTSRAAAATRSHDTAADGGKGRLLGDIPSLKKPKPMQKVSAEKAAVSVKVCPPPSRERGGAAYSYDSNAAMGVDPSFLCALTRQVMKNPVSSPYGHTFEKEAILAWLEQNGSVCPITGKTLTTNQLTPNKEVATRIMQQVMAQSMQAQAAQDDSDLYKF